MCQEVGIIATSIAQPGERVEIDAVLAIILVNVHILGSPFGVVLEMQHQVILEGLYDRYVSTAWSHTETSPTINSDRTYGKGRVIARFEGWDPSVIRIVTVLTQPDGGRTELVWV